MPVRGKRRLYLIDAITVNLDDDPDATDAPGGTTRPIIVKMKKAIENNFSAFEQLSMVFPRTIPTDCLLIKTLSRSEHRDMLLTLPELRQLSILP